MNPRGNPAAGGQMVDQGYYGQEFEDQQPQAVGKAPGGKQPLANMRAAAQKGPGAVGAGNAAIGRAGAQGVGYQDYGYAGVEDDLYGQDAYGAPNPAGRPGMAAGVYPPGTGAGARGVMPNANYPNQGQFREDYVDQRMPFPDVNAGGRPAVGAARGNPMGGIAAQNPNLAPGMRGPAAQQYAANQMRGGFNDGMGGLEDEGYDEGYEDYDMMGMAGQQGYDDYGQGYGMPNPAAANRPAKPEFSGPARQQGYGNTAPTSAMAGVMMNQGADIINEPFTMEGSLNSQTFDRKPGFDRTRKKVHEREKMREAVQKSKQSGTNQGTNGAADNNPAKPGQKKKGDKNPGGDPEGRKGGADGTGRQMNESGEDEPENNRSQLFLEEEISSASDQKQESGDSDGDDNQESGNSGSVPAHAQGQNQDRLYSHFAAQVRG
eukprot:GABU01009408.1.p1 GENE.GABU01009408.1~~GABU01009408.1.p1  ORF type:complete len:446 (-),score=157.16 GABU01009408.1:325-1623(-)